MKFPVIILIFFVSITLTAQDTEFNHQWGEIEQQHLEMLAYAKDSSADAVNLLNYCKVYYEQIDGDRGMSYNYHIRIKVLDKSKFNSGDIRLFSNGSNKIQSVQAQTINWDGNQKTIHKVEKVYEKDISKQLSTHSFSFPNIQNGSILEYQYVVFSNNYRFLRPFYFQNSRPSLVSEYHIAVPEDKSYIVLIQGADKPAKSGTQAFDNPAVFFESTEYFWIYNDIPAMKKENYTTTLENYICKIRLQLRSEVSTHSSGMFSGLGVQSSYSPFIESWESLGDLYYKYHKPLFGEQFQIRPVAKQVQPLLANATTTKDSILIIFDFVRENMTWNKRYSDYLDQRPRDVFEKKKGDSGEINFILMSLFYNFGLETYPIMLSTRDHGNVNHQHAFMSQFNQVIIAVNAQTEWLFLDASDISLPYNLLPIQDLNYEGLLVKNDTSYFINIPFESSESTTFMKAKMDKDGTLNGNLTIAETTYRAAKSRGKILSQGKEDYQINFFSKTWIDAQVTDIQYKNLIDKTKRLTQVVTFSAENVGQVAGDFIYINAFMGMGTDENPFKLESRTYPVELPYPIKETFMLNIEIPEGYTVEALPEPYRYNLPNKDGSFNFAVQEKNGTITISSRMSINAVKFETYQYEAIKTLFDNLVEKQTMQIVLKKGE